MKGQDGFVIQLELWYFHLYITQATIHREGPKINTVRLTNQAVNYPCPFNSKPIFPKIKTDLIQTTPNPGT
ncbi:hypothetical protein GCM10007390_19440 [Persicitalea jodogahamensis]|uniref:Uncharacterized protein n=1 Tax=Persicitalea jodogahamensis TaxID=402147 RepID=A0A8J3D1T8_9BACT|nr:hypothetical protein GCM10007390_19440 [Persicitalea jodogahamensis]